MNSNLISKAVRYALVAGAASALAAPAVFAQDATQSSTNQNQNQNANTAQLGKIEVTGTRIKRTDVETAQPVTIITAAQIKASGLTSIGDVLANMTSVYSTTNLQVNNGGSGANEINLRNLGTNRVLVLVNGKRWAQNLASAVDLNTIPSSIIDHIEILQDGASAIYGSDAIAGVVNIITIKNYNGAEANAYLGIYHGDGHTDGKTQEYDYTIGTSSDKSGVVFNVSYTNQAAVYAGNRNISKEPVVGTGNYAGSSGTPLGRFLLLAGPGVTTCANGVTPAGQTGVGALCDYTLKGPAAPGAVPSLSNFRAFSLNQRFNFAPLNYLITPTETTSLYLQSHYDLADNLTFNSTALYNNRNSQTQLAPEPFFIGAGGSYAANGQNGTPAAHVSIDKTNPYNPFGQTLLGCTSSLLAPNSCIAKGIANGDQFLAFSGRRNIEGGDRVHNINQDTFFWNAGVNGYFNAVGNEWDWDVGASYSRQSFQDSATGSININNLVNALGPAFLPAGATNIPANYQCGTAAAPIPGCVPLNWFGGVGTITPAMENYLLTTLHNLATSNQRDYSGNITGSLFNLPAGPVGSAAGFEYLENDGDFSPDNLEQTGISSNGTASPTNGRESTRAEYLEFNIPIVADVTGFKNLSLDVANRWSQFHWDGGVPGTAASTVVNTANASTGRAALRWQVTDSLLLRGSWSQGFRLPSVSEFFGSATFSFNSAADPCASTTSGGQLSPGSKVPKFCPPGVTTTPGVSGRPQPNSQILNILSGNTALTPERSISKTFGFVYSPDWVPGFDISADYYHIDLRNAVGVRGEQNILNSCYYANTDCNLILPADSTTNKTAPILQVANPNINFGYVHTSGIDIISHYKFPSTAAGDFKLGLSATFLRNFDEEVASNADPDTGGPNPSGFAVSHLAGSVNFPRRRATLDLNWNYGDWSANYGLQFIGAQVESCNNPKPSVFPTLCTFPNGPVGPNGFAANTTDNQGFHTNALGVNHIGSATFTNVVATYHLDSWNTDFSFGIRNLWNKDPPISLTAFANSFQPGLYPTPGRFFYARVGVKF